MFIKLTGDKNGKPVYINPDYIGLVYEKIYDQRVTIVELVGLGTCIVKVRESVDEVIGLIRGNGK